MGLFGFIKSHRNTFIIGVNVVFSIIIIVNISILSNISDETTASSQDYSEYKISTQRALEKATPDFRSRKNKISTKKAVKTKSRTTLVQSVISTSKFTTLKRGKLTLHKITRQATLTKGTRLFNLISMYYNYYSVFLKRASFF